MSLEPIDMDHVRKIADHFGLQPIKIRGTSQVQICKHLNQSKYQIIGWDEFEAVLNERNLSVYKDSSSCFLKIMKKK